MTPLHESLNRLRSLSGLTEASFDPTQLNTIQTINDVIRTFGPDHPVAIQVFGEYETDGIEDGLVPALAEYKVPHDTQVSFAGLVDATNCSTVLSKACFQFFNDPEGIMTGHAEGAAESMFQEGHDRLALFVFSVPAAEDEDEEWRSASEDDDDNDGDDVDDGDSFWLFVAM